MKDSDKLEGVEVDTDGKPRYEAPEVREVTEADILAVSSFQVAAGTTNWWVM